MGPEFRGLFEANLCEFVGVNFPALFVTVFESGAMRAPGCTSKETGLSLERLEPDLLLLYDFPRLVDVDFCLPYTTSGALNFLAFGETKSLGRMTCLVLCLPVIYESGFRIPYLDPDPVRCRASRALWVRIG